MFLLWLLFAAAVLLCEGMFETKNVSSCVVFPSSLQAPVSTPDWRVMHGPYLWVQQSTVDHWGKISKREKTVICSHELRYCSKNLSDVCTETVDNSTQLEKLVVDSDEVLAAMADVTRFTMEVEPLRPHIKAIKELPLILSQLNATFDEISSLLDLLEN